MTEPEENAPASMSGEAGAAAIGKAAPGDGGVPTIQKEGRDGSYSVDDPDRPRWDAQTKLIAEYEYKRPDGTYSSSVVRGERSDGEKGFLTGRRLKGDDLIFARQDRPHDLYKWPGLTSFEKGQGDEPDLLYRLDGLVRSADERPNDIVFICEGEKDVDRLHELGFIATTNPHGALHWRAEFSVWFDARDVAVLVDNDRRGNERAARILADLEPVARSIKAIEFKELPPKSDVSDYLDGHSKDDFIAKVVATPVVTSASAWANDHGQLARDENGRPFRSIANARIALALLGATVRFDEFAGRFLVDGLRPLGPVLDDAALNRLRLLCEERLTLAFAKDRFIDIVTDYARHNTFHPVRDYLAALRWDGTARLDSWLVTYGGAEDGEYVRAVGAICLIAAVRRVREPGCKFDEMLVLESEQGTDKSSALAVLAGSEEWFSDDVPLDAESKTLMERLEGRWLVELAELKGMKRGEVEHVKAMLSRRVDKARPAYGRMTREQPRQCVFFGTTNDSQYLRDMTGNRRFWPVKVARFDLQALSRDRDQLWAEAAQREAEGASIRLPAALWGAAGDQQARREVGDPFHEALSEWLDGYSAGKVRAHDVWATVGLSDVGSRSQDHNMRVSAAMQKLGWRRPPSKLRFGGTPQAAWVKGDPGREVGSYPEIRRPM